MTHTEFARVLEERITKTRDTLGVKVQGYAIDYDRLYNFRTAVYLAKELGDKPPSMAQVCWGYMLKHLTSILDMVENPERCGEKRAAMVDEKIGDAINYLILLEAIFREGMSV